MAKTKNGYSIWSLLIVAISAGIFGVFYKDEIETQLDSLKNSVSKIKA